MTTEESNALESAIMEVLSKDFGRTRILKVIVTEDEDFEGDEILKVQVIFEGEPKDLEAGALSSSIRHIRTRLSSMNEFKFPLTSFIAEKDAGFLLSA